MSDGYRLEHYTPESIEKICRVAITVIVLWFLALSIYCLVVAQLRPPS